MSAGYGLPLTLTQGVSMYDKFDTIEAAKHHYRRCRTVKHFILAADAAKDLKCNCCQGRVGDPPPDHPDAGDGYRSNISMYLPKHKRIIVMHYLCAWGNLMQRISELSIY